MDTFWIAFGIWVGCPLIALTVLIGFKFLIETLVERLSTINHTLQDANGLSKARLDGINDALAEDDSRFESDFHEDMRLREDDEWVGG